MNNPRPHGRSASSRALEQCTGREKTSPLVAGLVAFGAHALLCAAVLTLGGPAQTSAARPRGDELYEVELAPPPPPPPEQPSPEPEPPRPEPKATVKAPKAVAEPVPEAPPPAEPEPEPPAPVAAQAAEAVTAAEQAPGPADTLVTGQGAQFAGGTTERGGTATQAVQAPNARALGVAGGTGNGTIDRSRAPQLASGSNWQGCPFPDEAADDGVEQATVPLVIDVAADGKVLGVEVKQDPGYGFAREARACAFRKRWLPGLDRNGQPARGKLPVNVRFTAR